LGIFTIVAIIAAAKLRNMETIRGVFYIIASVALVLVSLAILGFFYLMVRIKQISEHASTRLIKLTEKLTLTGLIFRILRRII
jgi:hypothetical protein